MTQQASFKADFALGEAQRPHTKPRVIVTGGSGKLGRATVQHLSETWEVISVDTRRPAGISEDGKSGLNGAYRLVEVDLEDMGSVLETFHSCDMGYAGIDAVVHLAAIPSPGQTSSSRQFRTNVMSTYNVLEACRKLNIKNIVLASSETLIGIPFDPHAPDYLPIDESTPRRPESAYSLSKLVGETIAEEYTRWDPSAKIVSLRFSNVMLPAEYGNFESWQEDPKLRYWNAWGYIGKSFCPCFHLIVCDDTNVRRCSRWCPVGWPGFEERLHRPPPVPNRRCRHLHAHLERRTSQASLPECQVHTDQRTKRHVTVDR